jgi:hydrogenase expression/formation protein HypC
MCIGIPMRIVSVGEPRPWCEGLDNMLVGDHPVGTWVLAFQGSALRLMTADEAAKTNDALDALEAVLAGADNLDAYFTDLVDRDHAIARQAGGSKP